MPILRKLAGIFLVLNTTACFPAVIHGPRVDPGLGVGVTVAATLGPTYTEGDEGGIHLRQGHVGAHVGYGWAPSSPGSAGLYLGLAVPVLFPLAQVDAFLQVPPAWLPHNFAAGAGINLSRDSYAPYAQFGWINDAGQGWFLTQAFSNRFAQYGRTSSPASVTGAVIQTTREWLRSYLFAQYAVGRIPGECSNTGSTGVCRRSQSQSLAFGLTLECRRRAQR